MERTQKATEKSPSLTYNTRVNKTQINSKEYELPNKTINATNFIRNENNLTGTKKVCGSGVCGACTVLVDGKPICSCLLSTKDLEDKKVTTVEGISKESELHPVQKAFADHDAFQCGYCTPGFLTESYK